MLHAKFQGHRTFGSEIEDFKKIYHMWASRLSWSFDV